ncbi:MAG: phage tail protein [Proteobacteria bacterium]|nr:phage tail protein [Pseudomonadota bacterium]
MKKLTHGLVATAVVASLGGFATCASAQAEPFIGQIMCAGFNFAPNGWAELNGQLLPISTNTALFSLLGTTYGGDGRVTFGLPDMRGRVLMHAGQGPGLSNRNQGEIGGTETQTIGIANMPAHTHQVAPLGSGADATAVSPAGAMPASKARTTLYTANGPALPMAATTSSSTGGGSPISNMQPYVVVKCFMALQGIFPSRP